MRLSRLVVAAATVIAAPAAWAQDGAHTFTRDGRTYTYTMVDRADGSRVIAGREHRSGQRFRLKLADGRVSGSSQGHPVSFGAPATGAGG